MKRIYIAGALNADACGYIQNLHRMIHWAIQVRRLGVAVFVPGLDLLMGLVDGKFEYKDYFDNNAEFIEPCHALFIVPKSEESKGTQREIVQALLQKKPVFYKIEDLKEWLLEKGLQ